MTSRSWPLLLILTLPACEGCTREDRPYTPFRIASQTPSSSGDVAPDSGPADAPADAAAPLRAPARRVAPPAERITMDGRALDAPAGRLIAQVMVHDFSGNGTRDALLWTVPRDEGPVGQLVRTTSDGRGRVLYTTPGWLPSGPECHHDASLVVAGSRSLTLDVRATCKVGLLPGAPTRVLAVLAPSEDRPLRMALRIADLPGESGLTLEVDGRDRDGDQVDDIWLRVGQSWRSTKTQAALVWLARAQGAARDTSEPARSLGVLASAALSRARRAATAQAALSEVAAIRVLASSLCGEGGRPRVTLEDGSAITCSPTLLADRLLLAELHAFLVQKDVQAAFGAYDRRGWYLASPTPAQDKAAQKLLLDRVKTVKPERKVLSARVDAPRPHETLSPLAFDEQGTLWVQSASGFARIGEDGAAAPSDLDSHAPWPRTLALASGTLTGVAYACERPEVLLTWERADGRVDTVPLDVLAPRPGGCAPGSSFAPPSWSPLGLRDGTAEVLLGTTPAGARTSMAEAAMRPQLAGAARSPSGRWLVSVSSLGLLVVGLDRAELWTGDAVNPSGLGSCTVDDAAGRIACVRGKAVELFRRG